MLMTLENHEGIEPSLSSSLKYAVLPGFLQGQGELQRYGLILGIP